MYLPSTNIIDSLNNTRSQGSDIQLKEEEKEVKD